jgi:hypothetical protein
MGEGVCPLLPPGSPKRLSFKVLGPGSGSFGSLLPASPPADPSPRPAPYLNTPSVRASSAPEEDATSSKNARNWVDSCVSYSPRFMAHRYPIG